MRKGLSPRPIRSCEKIGELLVSSAQISATSSPRGSNTSSMQKDARTSKVLFTSRNPILRRQRSVYERSKSRIFCIKFTSFKRRLLPMTCPAAASYSHTKASLFSTSAGRPLRLSYYTIPFVKNQVSFL